MKNCKYIFFLYFLKLGIYPKTLCISKSVFSSFPVFMHEFFSGDIFEFFSCHFPCQNLLVYIYQGLSKYIFHLILHNSLIICIINCMSLKYSACQIYWGPAINSGRSFITAWAPLQICGKYFVLISETMPETSLVRPYYLILIQA